MSHITVHCQRTSKQELNGRSLEAGADVETTRNSFTGLFFLVGSVCFFIYSTWDQLPRGGTTHSYLGTPHQPPIKKMQHRLIWWEHFLSGDSLFPDDPTRQHRGWLPIHLLGMAYLSHTQCQGLYKALTGCAHSCVLQMTTAVGWSLREPSHTTYVWSSRESPFFSTGLPADSPFLDYN